ncbi:kelch-like protein 2 [Sarcoptes scabiei]|uniref:Kelch-like protein 2 n=1 Tax=Sarcoptes scabiei TaxID=52283 RepID=A0A132A240_SARSC|nr:kelch-like protein 2 [Sarcoptes scabiei]
MIESRCFHSAVLCGRSIIVCGGKNDRERLRSCELYDIENNRWSRFPSLNVPRSDAAACLFREKIYIAGGVDIFTLSSVEVYSFRAKSWTMINFMNVPRRSFSLIAYHGYLYAIGGCTEIYEYNWFPF